MDCFQKIAIALTALLGAAFLPAAARAEPNTAASVPLPNGIGGSSLDLHFDRNGRFAVFWSDARNLVANQDTGGNGNIFLYDRIAGSVLPGFPRPGRAGPRRRPGRGLRTAAADQRGRRPGWPTARLRPTWSPGRKTATPLPTCSCGAVRLGRHRAGQPSRGSAGSRRQRGLPPPRRSQSALSDDGRFLAYASGAADLVAGQTANAASQLYLFDRQAGASVLVSHAATSLLQSAGERSELPPSSARPGPFRRRPLPRLHQPGGQDLVTGITDSNSNFDVYLWDRDAGLAGSLRLLSRRFGAPQSTGNGSSDQSVDLGRTASSSPSSPAPPTSKGWAATPTAPPTWCATTAASNQVVLISHNAAVPQRHRQRGRRFSRWSPRQRRRGLRKRRHQPRAAAGRQQRRGRRLRVRGRRAHAGQPPPRRAGHRRQRRLAAASDRRRRQRRLRQRGHQPDRRRQRLQRRRRRFLPAARRRRRPAGQPPAGRRNSGQRQPLLRQRGAAWAARWWPSKARPRIWSTCRSTSARTSSSTAAW